MRAPISYRRKRKKTRGAGNVGADSPGEEFARLMHTDIEKWIRLTREAGIKPQ
jgi:hypothetical protein